MEIIIQSRNEEYHVKIEDKLDYIFIDLFGLKIEEENKNKCLFDEPFNMVARNFLILFLEIEKQYNILFTEEAITKMKNISFNGIVEEIRENTR